MVLCGILRHRAPVSRRTTDDDRTTTMMTDKKQPMCVCVCVLYTAYRSYYFNACPYSIYEIEGTLRHTYRCVYIRTLFDRKRFNRVRIRPEDREQPMLNTRHAPTNIILCTISRKYYNNTDRHMCMII